MAQFSKKSFDATGYLASRPTYPARIYDVICAFHKAKGGKFEHALDIGCGPGFMAHALSPRFASITGIDPSADMVRKGMQPDPPLPPITYRVGGAEDLGAAGIAPNSVDLAVAGQAAHWFDHAKVWPQLARALRPGGTVAYVGYGELLFPTHPDLDKHFTAFHHSRETLGPYWSQPGRSIVEGLLDKVPFPVTVASDSSPARSEVLSLLATLPDCEDASPTAHPVAESIQELNPAGVDPAAWDNATNLRLKRGTGTATPDGKWYIHREWTAAQFEAYARTSSALSKYHEVHPEDLALGKAKGGKGDVVDRFVDTLRAEFRQRGIDFDSQEVPVAWPLVLVMIGKKNEP